MNKNPLKSRKGKKRHYPYNKKPEYMCKWKYCYERGKSYCKKHRAYMAINTAKWRLTKKYGVSTKELSTDLVKLLNLVHKGYAHNV